MSIGAALVGLAMLPFTGLPAAAAWPWVRRLGADPHRLFRGADRELRRRRHGTGLSAGTRLGAADDGDRRGRCGSSEHIGLLGWLGIAVLAAGVLLLSLRGSRDLAKLDRRAIGFALLTAVTICAYTLVDGVGARAAGNAHAYTAAICSSASAWRWRSMRWCGAAARCFRADDAALAARRRRRRHAGHVLRHRDLGDDGGADRARGGAARNQRAVRHDPRRRVPEGAAADAARRRRADDRLRAGADPAKREIPAKISLRADRARAAAADPPARPRPTA